MTEPPAPSRGHPARRTGDLLLAAAWVATLLLIWRVRRDVSWFEENAPVEDLQSLFLFVSALMLALCARRPEERPYRLELLGTALFVFCMFIRETDVRGTRLEPILGTAQRQGWQWMAVTPLWLAVIALGLRRLRPVATHLLRWLLSPGGALMALGGVCYLVADRAEKGWFTANPYSSTILEESIETVGCLLILAGSYLAFRVRGAFARAQRRAP